MKRVLFFGSEDFTWTRPVNRVFLDLRPETHIVCCMDTTPGRIALRTAQAHGYKTEVPPWSDETDAGDWDDAYWFSYSTAESRAILVDAAAFTKRLHLFVSRRPDPRPVEEARSASPG